MSKTKIKGIVTDVKVVEIEIHPETLVIEALPFMKINDAVAVLKRLLEEKFRANDPSIPVDAEINWHYRLWEVYSFTDYHKNDDVYDTVRKFNDEENQYIIALDALMAVFK